MTTPKMIEVTYPYFLGGFMQDGYQADDQVMAQAAVDAAAHSATLIERERTIEVLEGMAIMTPNGEVGVFQPLSAIVEELMKEKE
jgi:hypothetical protein